MNRFFEITTWTLITICALLLFMVLFGCATEIPKPIIGELQTDTVKVAIPVSCIDEANLPKRPGTNMPPPDADVARLMAGAVADARTQSAYSTELEAVIRACATAGGKK